MLHNKLANYLSGILKEIQLLENVAVEKYEEEILTPYRINLRIRIRFMQGYLLEINEAAYIEKNQLFFLSYRYHLQNAQNKLMFHYDDAPHFPQLATFPHHKHLPHIVENSQKPSYS
jgi:hypothetical protein